MRRLFLFAWLLVPVAAGAYHFGPGQDGLKNDEIGRLIARGRSAAEEARSIAAREGDEAARGSWVAADEAFSAALALVPAESRSASAALKVERAKARSFTGQLFEAREELEQVVVDLEEAGGERALLADARGALANAQYYSTWLLRLEGAPREEWSTQIDGARQNYKLLATQARERGDGALALAAERDLEAAIRLERMALDDLQGLPLPSQ